MKKYTLLLTALLTVVIALNGCTVTIINEDENIQEEKEAFAVNEIQNEDEKTFDEVETTEDESEESAEKTASPAGGPLKFVMETYENEIVATNGGIVAIFEYSYPVFEPNESNDAEYIEEINKMFKNNALDFLTEAKSGYEDFVEECPFVLEDNLDFFAPNEYSYSCEIHTNAKGIISVTETQYFYYMGAPHGSTARTSYTFDVVEGKRLSLSDLLRGTDEEITSAYVEEFLKNKHVFFGDPVEIVVSEFPNAQHYVDANGVTVYFQEYQVASYAAGFVSATISDKEMLKFDFSDIK